MSAPLHVSADAFAERLDDSTVWEVFRHTPVYLLGTALSGLLDTAHPWVARGIAENSTLFENPRRRAAQTYMMLTGVVFGDADTVRKISRRLFRLHAGIQGELRTPSGSFRSASNRSLPLAAERSTYSRNPHCRARFSTCSRLSVPAASPGCAGTPSISRSALLCTSVLRRPAIYPRTTRPSSASSGRRRPRLPAESIALSRPHHDDLI